MCVERVRDCFLYVFIYERKQEDAVDLDVIKYKLLNQEEIKLCFRFSLVNKEYY